MFLLTKEKFMSRRSNRSRDEWEKLVKEWKASGSRITPWSKKHEVPIDLAPIFGPFLNRSSS